MEGKLTGFIREQDTHDAQPVAGHWRLADLESCLASATTDCLAAVATGPGAAQAPR